MCTIAGSDPTGGAGIQGDLRTFAAHGGHGSAVVTAVTAQGQAGVTAVRALAPDLVAAQLEAVFAAAPPRAWKTGMLAAGPIVKAVAGVFDRTPPPLLVVDPVLAAGAGGALLDADGLAALRARLRPHATLVTPNLEEAARLLGRDEPLATDEAPAAAAAIRAQGWRAVLVKGGHGAGATCTDVLATGDGVRAFTGPRLEGGPVHGTGCALSAAIAARLGRGESLADAIQGARAWVRDLIGAAHAARAWLPAHLASAPPAIRDGGLLLAPGRK